MLFLRDLFVLGSILTSATGERQKENAPVATTLTCVKGLRTTFLPLLLCLATGMLTHTLLHVPHISPLLAHFICRSGITDNLFHMQQAGFIIPNWVDVPLEFKDALCAVISAPVGGRLGAPIPSKKRSFLFGIPQCDPHFLRIALTNKKRGVHLWGLHVVVPLSQVLG